jgi:Ubiquitin carboxyl-terminal hydrolase
MDSSSDDEVSAHSPDTITPVAPTRKARRRGMTLEKPEESRGRLRSRSIRPHHTDSDHSDTEDFGLASQSPAVSTLTPSVTPSVAPVVTLEMPEDSAVSTNINTSPVSIPRPSILSAPPRYIFRKAYKRIMLQNSLPPVMILHLKRFYGTTSGSMKKIDDFVSFETEIDFAPFVFPIAKKPKLLYRLTGVVIHLGSINSGQYVPC